MWLMGRIPLSKINLFRDVKSANILVCNESGECVIADLGFAMILDPSADAKELANTGQVCVMF